MLDHDIGETERLSLSPALSLFQDAAERQLSHAPRNCASRQCHSHTLHVCVHCSTAELAGRASP